jgi:hypothetical protein
MRRFINYFSLAFCFIDYYRLAIFSRSKLYTQDDSLAIHDTQEKANLALAVPRILDYQNLDWGVAQLVFMAMRMDASKRIKDKISSRSVRRDIGEACPQSVRKSGDGSTGANSGPEGDHNGHPNVMILNHTIH